MSQSIDRRRFLAAAALGVAGAAVVAFDPLRGGWTVGVLVQANYGRRELLRIDGVPVGREISRDELPSAWDQLDGVRRGADRSGPEGGSIIVVVATDAPLLPHQCARLAQRPSLGLGRMGSYASHGSGDLFIAFATGNRNVSARAGESDPRLTASVSMVVDAQIDPLFEATVEATEEAIVNALVAAETMTGRDGVTAHALPHERLREVMSRYARARGPSLT